MNPQITALLERIRVKNIRPVPTERIARMDPETLLRELADSQIWHVNSRDSIANVPALKSVRGTIALDVVERFSEYLIRRLSEAVDHGFPALFVEEPSMSAEVYLRDIKVHLQGMGLEVELGRVSRHRYCDHNNGKGKKCLYETEFDHGSGDISALYLQITLPSLVPAA